MPVQWEKAPPYIRNHYLDQHREYLNSSKGPDSLRQARVNIHRVLDFIHGMNKEKCKKYKPEDLILHAGVMVGAEEYFQNEAKMALRLANFISAFLQVSDPHEVFSGKRVADKPLTEDQMIGETLAIVMGDSRIWSAGTYWNRNKFTNRTLFAPYAYKTELNTRNFKVEDLARLNKSDEVYLNKPWFRFLKQRWATNFDNLEKFNLKIRIRFNETGESTVKYEHYPYSYQGAKLTDGLWTAPFYDCYGKVPMWKIKYVAPFFGWNSLKAGLEFKGAVAVTMDMMKLDINQCTDKYWVPNVFKDTNKCDQKSSYCVPILGRGFEAGGYKCECKQGYEYPFEDLITYYDGQLVEAEFSNLVDNNETRFDMFKCRLAGASGLESNLIMVLLLVAIIMCVRRF